MSDSKCICYLTNIINVNEILTMQHMLGKAKPKGVYNASASTSLPFHSNA